MQPQQFEHRLQCPVWLTRSCSVSSTTSVSPGTPQLRRNCRLSSRRLPPSAPINAEAERFTNSLPLAPRRAQDASATRTHANSSAITDPRAVRPRTAPRGSRAGPGRAAYQRFVPVHERFAQVHDRLEMRAQALQQRQVGGNQKAPHHRRAGQDAQGHAPALLLARLPPSLNLPGTAHGRWRNALRV